MKGKQIIWTLGIISSLGCAEDIYYAKIRREIDRQSFKRNMLHESMVSLHNYLEDFELALLALPGWLYNDIVLEHPYQNDHAEVRCPESGSLAAFEESALYYREKRVKKALDAFIGANTLDLEGGPPRVALCFSGGGFRSMVATLGFLQGIEDIGLLDGITYISALSGSTWAIAPWIASGKSLQDYNTELVHKIERGLKSAKRPHALMKILHKMLEKLIYTQYLSTMDVYGPLLAHTLLSDLGDERFDDTISYTHQAVKCGSYPIPIYTAIYLDKRPYEWFEITPYELGSSHLNTYIPLWSYGRRFKAGNSTDTAKEQPLHYFMAIFGSAFAVDIKDVLRITGLDLLKLKTSLPSTLDSLLKKSLDVLVHQVLDQMRLFPSMLFNYMYKLPNCPLNSNHVLTLGDAGIDFNLPLPPLLRKQRKVDVIIVYDASAEGSSGSELSRAQEYALRNGFTFPPINYLDIKNKRVSVFKDDHDPTCPIIIYFPLIPDLDYSATFDPQECIMSGYCNTFNFKYGAQEIQELGGLARFVVNQEKEVLRTVIKEVVDRRTIDVR